MITGTRSILLCLAVAGCSGAGLTAERRHETASHLDGISGEELTGVKTFAPGLPSQIDITPANGASFSSRAQKDTITFSGFTTTAGQKVEVQLLSAPDAPIEESSWVTFATATTTSEAVQFNDSDPIFRWSVDATPGADESRWPAGGLLRYRTVAIDAAGAKTALPFFDHSAGRCFEKLKGDDKSWKAVLKSCKSPFSPDLGAALGTSKHAAALVGTGNSPTDNFFVPPYLNRKGAIFDVETDAYYLAIAAPETLLEYQDRYGFSLEGDDAAATYYNKGDLAIGREMHCKTFDNIFGQGTACYVRNYGVDADNQPDFSGDPHSAMFDAVRGENSFATVAMVKFGDDFAPADGNDVQFFVYNAQDDIVDIARLDTIGRNQSIPNNCINCHGGEYDRGQLKLTGASFLPFDPEAFLFPTRDGFTYKDQQEEIRKLNVLTKNAGGTPGTIQFVDGIYGGKAEVPGTVANLDWIPNGWSTDAESQTVYREMYKPYCRTCHTSQVGDFAFLRYEDFKNEAAKSADSICQTTEMPIAEATLREFWESPGRAYAVNALNLSVPCNGGK